MAFIRDKTAVRSFSAGFINTTGWYPLTILMAWDHTGTKKGPSKSVYIKYVTDSGQTGDFYIYYQTNMGGSTNADGKPLSGLKDINDLQIICDIETLNFKPSMVDVWDKDVKAELKLKKNVYADLVGRHVGVIFAMQKEKAWDKEHGCQSETETVMKPNFKGFCSDTGQSPREFLNNEEASSIDAFIKHLLENESIMRLAENQPNKPVQNAFKMQPAMSYNDNGDFDNDFGVPF